MQTTDVRQDLDHKLVPAVQGQLGLTAPANAARCPGDATELVVRLWLDGSWWHPKRTGVEGSTYIMVPGGRVVP